MTAFRRLAAGLALAATLFGGGGVWAQDREAQFRQTLEAVQAFINQQFRGAIELTAGDVRISTEASGALVATVPNVALGDPSGAGRLEIGTIVVTQRSAGAGRSRYAAVLPNQMQVVNRQGPQAAITIRTGQFETVVDDAARRMHEISLLIENFVARGLRDRGVLEAGLLSATYRLDERADQLVDSLMTVRFGGVRFQEPRSGEEAFRIGAIGLGGTVRGLSLASIDRYQAQVQAAQNLPPNEQMKAILEAMFSLGAQSMTGDIQLSDISATERGRQVFNLGSAGFATELAQLHEANARYGVRFTLENLTLPPGVLPTPYGGLVPSRVLVSLTAESVPTAAMRGLFTDGMDFGGAAPAMRPGAAEQFLMAVIASGATLRINPITVTTPALAAHLNGQMAANQRAPMQMTASGELFLRGLEQVMQLFSSGPGADRSVAQGLTMLQAMGQQGVAPDGQQARIYRFELGDDGRMMLNGTDLRTLMGGGGGGGAAPGRPPARTPQQVPAQPPPSK